jgi:hypothetical protein
MIRNTVLKKIDFYRVSSRQYQLISESINSLCANMVASHLIVLLDFYLNIDTTSGRRVIKDQFRWLSTAEFKWIWDRHVVLSEQCIEKRKKKAKNYKLSGLLFIVSTADIIIHLWLII